MKLQKLIDKRFALWSIGEDWHIENYMDDINFIKGVLQEEAGIEMSSAEVATFWDWRSNLICASWLCVNYDEEMKDHIIECFVKFVSRGRR